MSCAPSASSVPVTSIGECMIEVTPLDSGLARMHFAGDTFNFAYYLNALSKLCQCRVSYATALGGDKISENLLSQWREIGIDTQFVLRHPARAPGLYIAQNNPDGSKAYVFYRSQAAVREMFRLNDSDAMFQGILQGSKVLYSSAITGAILGDVEGDREKLVDLFRQARQAGIRTVFDSNYRKTLWKGGAQEAASFIDSLAPYVDIVLPTDEDLKAIYGYESPTQMIDHFVRLGVELVALKQGDKGCTVYADGASSVVSTTAVTGKIDTTAAGDSFNAGFLAATLQGLSARDAAQCANRVAATVLAFPGALIPVPNLEVFTAAYQAHNSL